MDFSREGSIDRGKQQIGGILLPDESGRSELDGATDELRLSVHGKYQNENLGKPLPGSGKKIEPARAAEVQVEDHQVDGDGRQDSQRLCGVIRLTADLHRGIASKEQGESFANDRVIVDEKNSYRGVGCSFFHRLITIAFIASLEL